jgi:hypothetical protein
MIAALCLLMTTLCACAKEAPPVPTTDSTGVTAAVFEGMADPHTIEVYVCGKPVAMQLKGDARKQAEGFEKGDEVYIRYERADGVLYALSIEKAPPAQ